MDLVSNLKEDIKEIKDLLKEIQQDQKATSILCAKQCAKIEFVEEKQKGLMNWVQGVIMMFVSALISYFAGGMRR